MARPNREVDVDQRRPFLAPRVYDAEPLHLHRALDPLDGKDVVSVSNGGDRVEDLAEPIERGETALNEGDDPAHDERGERELKDVGRESPQVGMDHLTRLDARSPDEDDEDHGQRGQEPDDGLHGGLNRSEPELGSVELGVLEVEAAALPLVHPVDPHDQNPRRVLLRDR